MEGCAIKQADEAGRCVDSLITSMEGWDWGSWQLRNLELLQHSLRSHWAVIQPSVWRTIYSIYHIPYTIYHTKRPGLHSIVLWNQRIMKLGEQARFTWKKITLEAKNKMKEKKQVLCRREKGRVGNRTKSSGKDCVGRRVIVLVQ